MNRISKQELLTMFSAFCKRMGENFELEYASCYGGYIITKNKGSFNIFGSHRRNTREMYDALYFAIQVLDYNDIKQTK